jgi:hypothetical protein
MVPDTAALCPALYRASYCTSAANWLHRQHSLTCSRLGHTTGVRPAAGAIKSRLLAAPSKQTSVQLIPLINIQYMCLLYLLFNNNLSCCNPQLLLIWSTNKYAFVSMLSHISLFFNNIFRSLFWPSSEWLITRIQSIYRLYKNVWCYTWFANQMCHKVVFLYIFVQLFVYCLYSYCKPPWLWWQEWTKYVGE